MLSFLSLYACLVLQEYLRKEVEHGKAATDLQESYAATCRKMGIEVILSYLLLCLVTLCFARVETHFVAGWRMVFCCF